MKGKRRVQYDDIFISIFPECKHDYSFFINLVWNSMNLCIPILCMSFLHVVLDRAFVNHSF